MHDMLPSYMMRERKLLAFKCKNFQIEFFEYLFILKRCSNTRKRREKCFSHACDVYTHINIYLSLFLLKWQICNVNIKALTSLISPSFMYVCVCFSFYNESGIDDSWSLKFDIFQVVCWSFPFQDFQQPLGA